MRRSLFEGRKFRRSRPSVFRFDQSLAAASGGRGRGRTRPFFSFACSRVGFGGGGLSIKQSQKMPLGKFPLPLSSSSRSPLSADPAPLLQCLATGSYMRCFGLALNEYLTDSAMCGKIQLLRHLVWSHIRRPCNLSNRSELFDFGDEDDGTWSSRGR